MPDDFTLFRIVSSVTSSTSSDAAPLATTSLARGLVKVERLLDYLVLRGRWFSLLPGINWLCVDDELFWWPDLMTVRHLLLQ